MPSPDLLPPDVLSLAARHVRDILALSLEHAPPARSLLVFDTGCILSRSLAEAWRRNLPESPCLDFGVVGPEAVLAAFAPLVPGDLVVLIQTTSFRLDAFRIRVELFRRGLKVVEHPHLEQMTGEEALHYVDALAYDPAYYRGVGAALKARIDGASRGEVDSGGERLVFAGPFEEAKLNVGDYRGMRNVGGQFPIGEVFTEAKDLKAVSGRMRLFAFADRDFRVNRPPHPITVEVAGGRIIGATDSTEAFERVLAAIRADEGEVWIRELGFGMNRAFGPERMVGDIGTVERMCGIHLSLGAKHAVYDKPEFRRRHGRHHVDVFAVTEGVWLDGERVFRDGAWTV